MADTKEIPDASTIVEPSSIEDAMLGNPDEIEFDTPAVDESTIVPETDDDQDGGAKVDAPETTPETPVEGETKVDTGDDPLTALMTETELGKTYDSPEAVLRAMPGTQAELQRRGQEVKQFEKVNAGLVDMIRKMQPQDQSEAGLTQADVDEFATEPTVAKFNTLLAKANLVQRSDFDAGMQSVQALQANIENRNLADDFSDHEDFRDVGRYVRANGDLPPAGLNPEWDKIMALTNKFPTLRKVSVNELIGAFHRPAAKPGKPAVPPVPPHIKAAATTTSTDRTSGGSGFRPDGLPNNWEKIDVDQQEKWLRDNGRI